MHANGPHATQAPTQSPHQPAPQQYVAHHEFGGSADLTTTIVHAISNVTGADVTEAEFSLADHVDPTALDRLFRDRPDGTPRSSGQVSFDVFGHRVTVFGDGRITIVPIQREPVRR